MSTRPAPKGSLSLAKTDTVAQLVGLVEKLSDRIVDLVVDPALDPVGADEKNKPATGKGAWIRSSSKTAS